MAEEKNVNVEPAEEKKPFPGFSFEPDPSTDEDNLLKQADPAKWLRQPPKKIRGDMKNAFKCAGESDKYKCTCWNKKCPFYGDCRKCIVFHMALKQIPTCQRDMIIDMYKEGILVEELYINEEIEREKAEKGE